MNQPQGETIADLNWQPGNTPGAEPRFDGEVERAAIENESDATIGLVRFINGARTYWHTHPREQVLVVVDGECRVRTRDGEEQVARAGQIVRLAAGVEHWHGAVAGTTMTHLTLTTGGQAQWNGPPTPR